MFLHCSYINLRSLSVHIKHLFSVLSYYNLFLFISLFLEVARYKPQSDDIFRILFVYMKFYIRVIDFLLNDIYICQWMYEKINGHKQVPLFHDIVIMTLRMYLVTL